MGDRLRCPKCNRYGNSELDGLCKACDAREFEDEALKVANGSKRMVESVLLEFNARSYSEVPKNERKLFFYMLKRRMPNKRGGHIARKTSKFEDYGYELPGEREKIGIEKEVSSIVRVE